MGQFKGINPIIKGKLRCYMSVLVLFNFLNEFYRFFGKSLINSQLNKNNTGARSKYTIISRTSPFNILGCWVVFFIFIQIVIAYPFKQAVDSLIGRRALPLHMSHKKDAMHIWVCNGY